MKQYKEKYSTALLESWPGEPFQKEDDSERAVRSCIEYQVYLGCEGIILSSPLIKCVDRGDDSAVVGELDLDAVRIPEREQLDRLAGRNLGQTVWAELRGSRYNLARAREKEYLAGPRGWAEARTNSERASTQTHSGKAYSQR